MVEDNYVTVNFFKTTTFVKKLILCIYMYYDLDENDWQHILNNFYLFIYFSMVVIANFILY